MRCPYCGYEEDKVVDSRPIEEGTAVRRRRECLSCLKRFTTYEKVEYIPLMVVKRDKTREPFSRQKLVKGMMRALEKRPVSPEKISDIADDIENKLYNSLKREVTSGEIGEMVMARLKELDEVAYIRFASVYRQFKDLSTFQRELRLLLQEK
ncbi:MAG: transcriptional regulator NrdR [Acetivibrionales bacterium]|jgi:transcriptional repressor NrdR